MATTDYQKEQWLLDTAPHTANALTKFIMAMAAVQKNRGKRSFLGRDKGLDSYNKFELRLKELLACMVLDGLILRSIDGGECLQKVVSMIKYATTVWPNWPDAYAFAYEFFIENGHEAELRIQQLLSAPPS